MGSKGRSWSSRGREGSRDYGGVDASEGFAPVRVVWICALWALVHSVLASKQVKDATICRHQFLRVAGGSELRRPRRLSARLQAALSGIRVVSEPPRRRAEGVSLPEYSA